MEHTQEDLEISQAIAEATGEPAKLTQDETITDTSVEETPAVAVETPTKTPEVKETPAQVQEEPGEAVVETDEVSPFFTHGENNFTQDQLTTRFDEFETAYTQIEGAYKEVETLMPLVNAINSGDTAKSQQILEQLLQVDASPEAVTEPNQDSSDFEKRLKQLEADKIQTDTTLQKQEETLALNESFSKAQVKYGKTFTDNQSKIVDFMTEHGLSHTQLDIAYTAFKAENDLKVEKKKSTEGLSNGKRSVTPTSDKNWINPDNPNESAVEAMARMGYDLDKI